MSNKYETLTDLYEAFKADEVDFMTLLEFMSDRESKAFGRGYDAAVDFINGINKKAA